MFKGYDRPKYDLKDPSAWMAMKRDQALHEQALVSVARHLNTAPPRQSSAQIPQILLPPAQQAALESDVPASMHAFTQEMLTGRSIDQFIKYIKTLWLAVWRIAAGG